jgi:NAD(P)-dependent dehydrogenase (short-subunit alcohol dehydrogenase family)
MPESTLSTPPRFAGRAAIVTGAGGGSGLEIARRLAAEGASVIAIDIKERPDDLPGDCAFLQGDVTDLALPDRAVEHARREYGGLDYLVNAAGVAWFGRDGSVVGIDDEVWSRVLEINLTAPMRFARASAPALRERRGAMVHVASVAGLRGMDDPLDAYQVSKAGLVSLSRGLAMALAADGVRSNTVCPGAIDTPILAGIYAEDPARRDRMVARTPLRRLGTPADVAEACLYLLSDAASFLTGVDLPIDGGWLSLLP